MAKAEIGLVGLAVMGANLATNIAEKGFRIAIHNRTAARIPEVLTQAGALAGNMVGCDSAEALVAAIAPPRAIIIMVKAGAPVDAVIRQFLPLLEKGDMLIDAGNANFHDTRRRAEELKDTGIGFVGMGVSGGEEGARHGPSIMVGGPAKSYQRIGPVVETISAKHKGVPCAAHVGPDGAGHFVKTVHNGIEYADMQMIAEIYGLLRASRKDAEIGQLFQRWNAGPLESYLIEITGKILQTADPETGNPMVGEIVDSAGQKGTGRWTVIEALALGQSASTIEAAVGARSWSADRNARGAGAAALDAGAIGDDAPAQADLEQALLAAKIIAYSQGFSLLLAADREYGWRLDLARIAEIWREGCIIRSALLDEMAGAARAGLPHGHLILSEPFAVRLNAALPALRRVVATSAASGQPAPALAAALAYYDTMRQARGTTNLIQAQRDFFGAHGFERLDGRTGQHGPWAMG